MRPHKNRDPFGAGLHGAAPSVERHEIRACGQNSRCTNVVKSSVSMLSHLVIRNRTRDHLSIAGISKIRASTIWGCWVSPPKDGVAGFAPPKDFRS